MAFSAFRDWVAEKMPTIPGDVAEAALAHGIHNKTEAAYRRADYLEPRRELMAQWADDPTIPVRRGTRSLKEGPQIIRGPNRAVFIIAQTMCVCRRHIASQGSA